MYTVDELKDQARILRQDVIRMLVEAGSGHTAGPLGMADVFSVLYFSILNHQPDAPRWPDRDRVVLSCGHICPILYATLARSGYFSPQLLRTFRSFGSPLQGHPSLLDLPGIETSSGPLGQGISQAVGMALALRADKNPAHVYCIASDGEHDEGQTWEALLFASKMKLQNMTMIVDRNDIQISGFTHDVLPTFSLAEKYVSFGWYVIDVEDGNSIEELLDAFAASKQITEMPVVILCHTIPGKGVSFMEHKWEWHGKVPDQQEALLALEELGIGADHEE